VTPVLFVLTLVASCAVAAASYRWIELPALRRKEAGAGGRTAARSDPQPDPPATPSEGPAPRT
jgi:peptidoglycan/LPS O-acetylase OafA/YrhL